MRLFNFLIVLSLVAVPSAFAAQRCRENGKFVKCPATPASTIAAPTTPVTATTPTPAVTKAVNPSAISVENVTSSKGKQFQRCRQHGKFVKCPK